MGANGICLPRLTMSAPFTRQYTTDCLELQVFVIGLPAIIQMNGDVMADRTRVDDEVNEFDLLLDEVEAEEIGDESWQRQGLLGGKIGGKASREKRYRPMRMRVTPNWSRIAAAGVVALLLLLVVVFSISSWMSHRTETVHREYVKAVGDLIERSDSQGQELEDLLKEPSGTDRAQLVARIDDARDRANAIVVKAGEIEPPKELVDEHRFLVTALAYRRNGLGVLKTSMTGALASKDKEAAAASVARATRRLAASDIVYADSFADPVRRELRRNELSGIRVPDSAFVKDPEFTSPKAIKLTLERLTTTVPVNGKKGAKAVKVPNDGKVRGGQIGQVVVSPSGQSLSATGVTEITGADSLAFEVPFENQGEVQATQVPVEVELRGDNTDPLKLAAVIDTVDPGQIATVKVPLSEVPVFGESLTLTIKVGPIPGEKKVDNNSATYEVMFRL